MTARAARPADRTPPATARELAPGKVNLCLFLGPARADGLHELVSLLEPVTLADELELAPTPATRDEVSCPGVEGPNLAAEALASFRAAASWDGPPVRVTIDKRIPVAAGMGGGSSDAAATLRLAARAAGRGADLLPAIAPRLGADVPALLDPGPVLVTGAGEHVEPLPPLPRPRPRAAAPGRASLDGGGVPRGRPARAPARPGGPRAATGGDRGGARAR